MPMAHAPRTLYFQWPCDDMPDVNSSHALHALHPRQDSGDGTGSGAGASGGARASVSGDTGSVACDLRVCYCVSQLNLIQLQDLP